MPPRWGPLAQLAEQQTLNLRVRGSSPWRLTINFLFSLSRFALRVAEKLTT